MSMIQFNLLPDVKAQYIKAHRVKVLTIFVATVVTAASLVVFTLLLVTVDVVQKHSLSNYDKDVATYSAKLTSTPDLSKILTVQNQLNTLTGLHDSKVVSSRLFGYLAQLTPNGASLTTLNVDYVGNQITMTGNAPTLDVVNSFTDTLKATTYTTGTTAETPTNAFTSVVLASFSRSDKSATYTITFNFDPLIFNSKDDITLTVPSQTAGSPSALFQKQVGN